MKNKRGDFTGVLFWVVAISAFAIFLLVVGYVVPLISSNLVPQLGISTEINNSLNASTQIAENTLPTIWLVLFAGLLLGLFITGYFIPTSPIYFPVFGLLMTIAVIVAIPLSNAYEELAANATLNSASLQQQLILFLMTHLPFVTLVVGILILIVTFAKPGGGSSVPI